MAQDISLDQFNKQLTAHIATKKQEIESKRINHGYTAEHSYLFSQLTAKVQSLIDTFLATHYHDLPALPCLMHRIDRAMYHADFTIKFDTALVRSLGKSFTSELLPHLVAFLQNNQTALGLVQIEQKGIYINCTVDAAFWGDICKQIEDLGSRYGDLDRYKAQTALVEYSSPNAAKHLHAGHVRSTVIGHVLSNLYEHAGYTVHRINHINDRGGFGQLIEGRKRWHEKLYATGLRDNELNYEIYTLWRQAEKLSKTRQEQEAKELENYFDISSQDAFMEDFASFTDASITNFHALEAGDPDVFAIRTQIVASSMVEFKEFYDKLAITHDYTIGESFYEKIGRQCIEQGEKTGLIVTFTAQLAQEYAQACDLAHPSLDPAVKNKKHEEIMADIGAKVVLLDNRERFVVLRSDGASIYATRDLGCLWFRTQTRQLRCIVYEVGQEQEDHFNKLFETADKFGWLDRADGTKTVCMHIAHGFYVDATTKKKLSSRAGASNVHHLIDATISYFKDKYAGSTDFTSEEIDHNAQTLGIASIIINDLSKERMDPVLIDADEQKMIRGFEQSGGAYLLYTICRAKSLLHKATVNRGKHTDEHHKELADYQISLLQQLSDLPWILKKAVVENEPSVLVQYAYRLTQTFNTMYGATDRMIDDPFALRLTSCYIQVMSNIMRLCGIEPLDRM